MKSRLNPKNNCLASAPQANLPKQVAY